MKTLRFSILGLLVMVATVCRAQLTDPGWFIAPDADIQPPSDQTAVAGEPPDDGVQPQGQQPLPPAIAEAITPDIQALANGLQNDSFGIFSYVQSHIRYVHYFGSKKGAELTLLERSGNDFDQCALLVALLRAAGYTNVGYKFGWQGIPYDDPFGLGDDLHHWLNLSFSNTNWLYTSNYVSRLFGRRGYPALYTAGDNNTFVFQRVWVVVTNGASVSAFDPAFKQTQSIAVTNLASAMNFSSTNLLSNAGGTTTGNGVSGLSEANISNTLAGCTANLLTYIQTNSPNASVQQILGGQSISSTVLIVQFPTYSIVTANGYTNGTVYWVNEPTNLMSGLKVTVAGTNWQCWTPQLQGQRLSLTFDTNGLAQLWLDDSNLVQNSSSGPSGTNNVAVDINHPFGSWDFTNNTIIRSPVRGDNNVTNSYQRTNATYALVYAFEPDWGWLRERQNKLDSYRQQGYGDSSRQVVSETLNVMGLNWMLQTEGVEQMLAVQDGVLPQYHHRFGRMAQEAGKGYYVDAYMQLSGEVSAAGADTANTDLENRHAALWSYFFSALENGIIEQLESSNLVAASTVRMLEIANAKTQTVYLASSTNWSAVVTNLAYYDTNYLYSAYITKNYNLLLPQNGSNLLAGAGSWAGYGIAARLLTSTNEIMTMLISGGYHGGYFGFPWGIPDVPNIQQVGDSQANSFTLPPLFTFNEPIADPVDTADGTFQVEHTDLSVGQAEPKGITLSRYYNGTRRNSNPAGMAPGWINNYYITANTVAAPQAALGGTTPAQAAAMMAATCAAIKTYTSTPDPKNWLVTALIAKWGADQMTKGGVSVNLGKDTIQFVRQPDGSFTPPGNSTMTLTQSGSVYTLQERRGRTFNFNTGGQLSTIVDQYGNTLSLAYTNSQVSAISDWQSRNTFSFTYTGGQLTSVFDGTRTISYGYTGSDLTSFTDAEGKTTHYTYDTNHNITSTVDANSQLVVSNLFDSLGHVTFQYTEGFTNKAWQIFWTGWQTIEQDPSGSQRVFFYDDQSRLVSVQDQLGHFTQAFYDGQNHVIKTLSPLNETNQYIYDGYNNLIATIDPLNCSNQFFYDGNNGLVKVIDARTNTSTFGYNGQFSLTGQTNGAGDWVNYTYKSDGTLYTRTDSGGQTSYGYDGNGLLNSVTYPSSLGGESFINNALGDATSHTDGNGNVTGYQYNKRRQATVTTAPTNIVAGLGYDAVGNVLASTNGRTFVTINAWSPTRKLLSTTLPATAQGTPVVTNSYDPRDWLAQTVNPLQQPLQFTPDAAGRMVAAADALSRTNHTAYDADGRQTAVTNAAGERTLQSWNKRGQPTVTTDNAGKTIKRGYDTAGNQITLTNRLNYVWSFQYDGANRLTNTVSPLSSSVSQTWNHQGLLSSVTDPAHNTTTNVYDGRGRLTSRTDPLATTGYGYDANNNLTSVVENGLTNAWTFDAYNHVSSYKEVYGNLIQYRYDANGNLTNLVYPGGKNVYYAYDSNDHLTNVTDWAGRNTGIAYDLAGHITGITRPNGTQRIIKYDADGETTNIVEEAASKYPIAFYTLGWMNAGRVQWEFAGPLPHTNAPPTRTMTFDAENKLATFKLGTGSTLTVSSDANGNLTNAPLMTNALVAYAYDVRNRLLNVGGVTNAYDAMNNRIGQTQGTNLTIFVVNPNAKLPQVLMRIKNGVTNYYIYGAGLLYQVMATTNGEKTLTYHYDYRGSTVALTDDNGNVTDRIEYSLYATTTYRAGTNDTPFLFNGRYGVMTDSNGLLYMRARYYNPYLCRFINPDPSGFAGGLNFYAYAGGNPVSYLDPFGLNSQATGETQRSWLDRLIDDQTARLDALESRLDYSAPWKEPLNDASSFVVLGAWDVLNAVGSVLNALGVTPDSMNALAAMPMMAPEARVLGEVSALSQETRAATQLELDFGQSLPWQRGESGLVIGRGNVLDLPSTLQPGEYTLRGWLDVQPMEANLQINLERLGNVSNLGLPIRDASLLQDADGFFLNGERNLLQTAGWNYQNGFWLPPATPAP